MIDKEMLIKMGFDYEAGMDHFGGFFDVYEKYLLKFFTYDFISDIRWHLVGVGKKSALDTVRKYAALIAYISLPDFVEKIDTLHDNIKKEKPDEDAMEVAMTYLDKRLKSMRALVKINQLSLKIDDINF